MTKPADPNELDAFYETMAATKDRRAKLETLGVAALPKLIQVARGDTGQSEVCRAFIIGLFNGHAFPFNLNDLRRLDDGLREAALTVLDMDTYAVRCEIHERIPGTGALIRGWAMAEFESRRVAQE